MTGLAHRLNEGVCEGALRGLIFGQLHVLDNLFPQFTAYGLLSVMIICLNWVFFL